MTTPTIDYLALLPVLAPAAGAILVLLLDAVAPRLAATHVGLGVLALGVGIGGAVPGVLVTAGAPVLTLCLPQEAGVCLYRATPAVSVLQIGALLASLVVLLLLWPAERHWSDRLVELRGGPALLVTLVLATSAGAGAVAAAQDVATWLIALELATLPVVALVALRGSRLAGSGALALLSTSLISFSLLVVGVALWVAATGDATFSAERVATAWADVDTRTVLVLSVLILLSGLGFKISAVPFHLWTPQAYTASREPVAALLATTSKIAAVAAAIVVLRPLTGVDLATVADPTAVRLGLAVVAATSMTVGNLIAFGQDDPVRLLAWSTIAQAGWVLLPLAAVSVSGVGAAAAYVLAYAAATILVFGVVTVVHTRRPGEPALGRTLAAYRGLFRTDPFLASALTLGLVSLAGLPPGVVGLLAKVAALRPVVEQGMWWLAIIAVVNAVIGVAVYLRWVAVLFGDPGERRRVPGMVPGAAAAVALGAVVVVVTSLAPEVLFGAMG